jgi:hypothetical protein
MTPPLDLTDQRHLDAADGWLGLGDWREANEELECITSQMRAHPSVLFVRYHVYAMAKKWEGAADIGRALSELVPQNSFGYVQVAYACTT